VAATASSPAAAPAPPRQRHADGIYGTIITASVLASAGDELATWPLTISVLITLAVYWVADVYAQLLAGQLRQRRLPTWRDVRCALGATWPMVSASFSPLLVLIAAWLFGASSSAGATAALAVAIVILIGYALAACRAAKLRGAPMVLVTAIAAALGVLMIVLKNVVLVQLH
jgi:hypothetical protein